MGSPSLFARLRVVLLLLAFLLFAVQTPVALTKPSIESLGCIDQSLSDQLPQTSAEDPVEENSSTSAEEEPHKDLHPHRKAQALFAESRQWLHLHLADALQQPERSAKPQPPDAAIAPRFLLA
jgi:hypothetical protein